MKSNLPKIAVLVSGNGSNLGAIIEACDSGNLAAQVALVVSNRPEAYALERAKKAGIKTFVLEAGEDRAAYDKQLAFEVAKCGVGLVVLAGWDRLLTSEFVSHHVTINLHPALPGSFPGLGAIKKSFESWQKGEINSSGVMVHYVPDEGVDDGPTIGTEVVLFDVDDTLESYEQRVHSAEHKLIVECIGIALDNLN